MHGGNSDIAEARVSKKICRCFSNETPVYQIVHKSYTLSLRQDHTILKQSHMCACHAYSHDWLCVYAYGHTYIPLVCRSGEQFDSEVSIDAAAMVMHYTA